ncbi:Katanin p80 WD40 repeat-containing subunit B1 like [Apostasia shenzhenica]|uniref:Katanin p80 WD40 repeat-containing subunit B1 like n=1 Tax=Apostasia shenzhenica TaxID=1088818 RepID=A0A2I0ABR0_9ASPA|nr:Katanin p80 WD40 repeat-containing subunit B1 like [Apostasia shenzhenica]
MAVFLNGDLEYRIHDYYNMDDFEDEEFWEGGQDRSYGDSDYANDVQGKQKTDTSAVEYRNGKDIQGIPWERLNYSRKKYREMRLKQYKNYENLARIRNEAEKDCKMVECGNQFYDFQFNTRQVKSTIVHFQLYYLEALRMDLTTQDTIFLQLRNLLWATSKHDVYMVQNYSVSHWSSLLRMRNEVLNVAGTIMPTMRHRGSMAHSLKRIQICTMAVKENLLVAGGFQGELVCKFLHHPGVDFCTKMTDDNAITNAVDIYRTSNSSFRVFAANNDCFVRVFDTENFTQLSRLPFSWSVNNTSVSPNGKVLAVLGDSTECLIADANSGKVVSTLKGHLDYSFASAWHPDGCILATGNQDQTCRLWDVRKLSESVAVLKGRIGAIRGIKFSTDGRFMAMAEPADFVHVLDVNANYSKSQEIDLFGEIAGICFSPDAEALFVGIADRTYGSVLEFRRRNTFQYVDCLI